jgi:hypothetical protein
MEIREKRAGSGKERAKRFREKGKVENMTKKLECQHD